WDGCRAPWDGRRALLGQSPAPVGRSPGAPGPGALGPVAGRSWERSAPSGARTASGSVSGPLMAESEPATAIGPTDRSLVARCLNADAGGGSGQGVAAVRMVLRQPVGDQAGQRPAALGGVRPGGVETSRGHRAVGVPEDRQQPAPALPVGALVGLAG